MKTISDTGHNLAHPCTPVNWHSPIEEYDSHCRYVNRGHLPHRPFCVIRAEFALLVQSPIPATLSVSGQDGLHRLQQLVAALRATPPDFYTFHFYSQAVLAYTTFKQAERIAAPTPLLIGETGVSTCTCYRVRGLQAAPRALEAYQDHYYRTVEYAARSLGLPPAAPWILSDFRAGDVPDTVSGKAD